MDQSQSLILLSAQVHFLDVELALIHIPLHLYNTFLQPILHMLLSSNTSSSNENKGSDESVYDHAFLNISVTPIECSVVCSRTLADTLFVPVRDSLTESAREQVAISKDNYIVMQVDGEGVDAGQRVVELTSPLAMNKIPLFFISTYFSDYILVPQPYRTTVITALEARGFAFESQAEAFVNIASPHLTPRPTSSSLFPSHHHYQRPGTASTFENPFDRLNLSSANHDPRPPPTPPPSSLDELETRTFATLKQRNITPHVDPSIQLIQCAERKPTGRSNANASTSPAADAAHTTTTSTTTRATRMQLSLVRCLIGIPRPSFFSLTVTSAAEAASLLLERRLLSSFGGAKSGGGMSDLLLGDPEEILVPVLLDLRELPMESTGIVCGVAGRLVSGAGAGARGDGDAGGSGGSGATSPGGVVRGIPEMSYLSTARAGAVIVAEAELERAVRVLGTDYKGRGGGG